MTDYALRYAQALKKRPSRRPVDETSPAGEGVGQGVPELVASLSPDEREHFEERAAIVEKDAGYPRDEAELLAVADVLPAPDTSSKLAGLEAWIRIKEQVRDRLMRHIAAPGDPLAKDAERVLPRVEAELVEARELVAKLGQGMAASNE